MDATQGRLRVLGADLLGRLLKGRSLFRDDHDEFGCEDCSITGNYFKALVNQPGQVATCERGNPYDNQTSHNHFEFSYDGGCGTSALDQKKEHSPDTGSPAADTACTSELDLSDPETYENFGAPQSASSVLVNRLSSVLVPVDVFGNPRDQTPDVGAIEYQTATPPRITAVDPQGELQCE